MRAPAMMPAPLLPDLANVLARQQSTPTYSVATGFDVADALHLLADVGGHRAGDVLEVIGYCLSFDEQGQPYGLRAYVRASATQAVTYQTRTAARFPEAGQQERWLGGVPMYPFTEIDITDEADKLALERFAPAVAAASAVPTRPAHRLAAGLRLAA